MADQETHVVYKAIADFTQLNAAVDQAKTKLNELKASEAEAALGAKALNAELAEHKTLLAATNPLLQKHHDLLKGIAEDHKKIGEGSGFSKIGQWTKDLENFNKQLETTAGHQSTIGASKGVGQLPLPSGNAANTQAMATATGALAAAYEKQAAALKKVNPELTKYDSNLTKVNSTLAAHKALMADLGQTKLHFDAPTGVNEAAQSYKNLASALNEYKGAAKGLPKLPPVLYQTAQQQGWADDGPSYMDGPLGGMLGENDNQDNTVKPPKVVKEKKNSDGKSKTPILDELAGTKSTHTIETQVDDNGVSELKGELAQVNKEIEDTHKFLDKTGADLDQMVKGSKDWQQASKQVAQGEKELNGLLVARKQILRDINWAQAPARANTALADAKKELEELQKVRDIVGSKVANAAKGTDERQRAEADLKAAEQSVQAAVLRRQAIEQAVKQLESGELHPQGLDSRIAAAQQLQAPGKITQEIEEVHKVKEVMDPSQLQALAAFRRELQGLNKDIKELNQRIPELQQQHADNAVIGWTKAFADSRKEMQGAEHDLEALIARRARLISQNKDILPAGSRLAKEAESFTPSMSVLQRARQGINEDGALASRTLQGSAALVRAGGDTQGANLLERAATRAAAALGRSSQEAKNLNREAKAAGASVQDIAKAAENAASKIEHVGNKSNGHDALGIAGPLAAGFTLLSRMLVGASAALAANRRGVEASNRVLADHGRSVSAAARAYGVLRAGVAGGVGVLRSFFAGAQTTNRELRNMEQGFSGASGSTNEFSSALGGLGGMANRVAAALSGMGGKSMEFLNFGWRAPLAVIVPLLAALLSAVNPLVAILGSGVGAVLGFGNALSSLAGMAAAVPGSLLAIVSAVGAVKAAMSGMFSAPFGSGVTGGVFQAFNQLQVAKTTAGFKGPKAAKTGGSGLSAADKADMLANQKDTVENDKQAITDNKQSIKRDREDLAWAKQDLKRAYIDTARAIKDAEDAVVKSQENAVKAQKNLTDARKQATKELKDLNKEVARAAELEKAAQANVQLSKENLANVLADPSSTLGQKMAAQAQLAQSKSDLQDTKDQNVENKQKLDYINTHGGVEGMDQVVQAKSDLKDALQAVADAMQSLKRTKEDAPRQIAQAKRTVQDDQEKLKKDIEQGPKLQRQLAKDERTLAKYERGDFGGSSGGGGGGAGKTVSPAQLALDNFNKAMALLSPSAQAFVKEILKLIPAWNAMKKSVQEALFKPLVKDLGRMKDLIPEIGSLLKPVAGAIGDFLDKFLVMVTGKDWKKDLKKIGADSAVIVGNIGDAVLAAVGGFKDLIVAAGPFTKWLTGTFAKGIEDLSQTISDGAKNGSLKKWLDGVEHDLKIWFDIVGNIISGLFGYFKGAHDLGQDILKSLDTWSKGFKQAGEDAAKPGSGFQKWLKDLKPIFKEVNGLFSDFFGWLHKVATDDSSKKKGDDHNGAITQAARMLQAIRDFGKQFGPLLDTLSRSDIGISLINFLTNLTKLTNDVMKNGGVQVIQTLLDLLNTIADIIDKIANFKVGNVPVGNMLLGAVVVMLGLAFLYVFKIFAILGRVAGVTARIGFGAFAGLSKLGFGAVEGLAKSLERIAGLIPGLGKLKGALGGLGDLAGDGRRGAGIVGGSDPKPNGPIDILTNPEARPPGVYQNPDEIKNIRFFDDNKPTYTVDPKTGKAIPAPRVDELPKGDPNDPAFRSLNKRLEKEAKKAGIPTEDYIKSLQSGHDLDSEIAYKKYLNGVNAGDHKPAGDIFEQFKNAKPAPGKLGIGEPLTGGPVLPRPRTPETIRRDLLSGAYSPENGFAKLGGETEETAKSGSKFLKGLRRMFDAWKPLMGNDTGAINVDAFLPKRRGPYNSAGAGSRTFKGEVTDDLLAEAEDLRNARGRNARGERAVLQPAKSGQTPVIDLTEEEVRRNIASDGNRFSESLLKRIGSDLKAGEATADEIVAAYLHFAENARVIGKVPKEWNGVRPNSESFKFGDPRRVQRGGAPDDAWREAGGSDIHGLSLEKTPDQLAREAMGKMADRVAEAKAAPASVPRTTSDLGPDFLKYANEAEPRTTGPRNFMIRAEDTLGRELTPFERGAVRVGQAWVDSPSAIRRNPQQEAFLRDLAHTSPERDTLYRGVSSRSEFGRSLQNLKPGDVLNDDQFRSFTPDEKTAGRFADGIFDSGKWGAHDKPGTLLRMQGGRAANLNGLGAYENEYLAPAGKYHVTGVSEAANGTKIVDIESEMDRVRRAATDAIKRVLTEDLPKNLKTGLGGAFPDGDRAVLQSANSRELPHILDFSDEEVASRVAKAQGNERATKALQQMLSSIGSDLDAATASSDEIVAAYARFRDNAIEIGKVAKDGSRTFFDPADFKGRGANANFGREAGTASGIQDGFLGRLKQIFGTDTSIPAERLQPREPIDIAGARANARSGSPAVRAGKPKPSRIQQGSDFNKLFRSPQEIAANPIDFSSGAYDTANIEANIEKIKQSNLTEDAVDGYKALLQSRPEVHSVPIRFAADADEHRAAPFHRPLPNDPAGEIVLSKEGHPHGTAADDLMESLRTRVPAQFEQFAKELGLSADKMTPKLMRMQVLIHEFGHAIESTELNDPARFSALRKAGMADGGSIFGTLSADHLLETDLQGNATHPFGAYFQDAVKNGDETLTGGAKSIEELALKNAEAYRYHPQENFGDRVGGRVLFDNGLLPGQTGPGTASELVTGSENAGSFASRSAKVPDEIIKLRVAMEKLFNVSGGASRFPYNPFKSETIPTASPLEARQGIAGATAALDPAKQGEAFGKAAAEQMAKTKLPELDAKKLPKLEAAKLPKLETGKLPKLEPAKLPTLKVETPRGGFRLRLPEGGIPRLRLPERGFPRLRLPEKGIPKLELPKGDKAPVLKFPKGDRAPSLKYPARDKAPGLKYPERDKAPKLGYPEQAKAPKLEIKRPIPKEINPIKFDKEPDWVAKLLGQDKLPKVGDPAQIPHPPVKLPTGTPKSATPVQDFLHSFEGTPLGKLVNSTPLKDFAPIAQGLDKLGGTAVGKGLAKGASKVAQVLNPIGIGLSIADLTNEWNTDAHAKDTDKSKLLRKNLLSDDPSLKLDSIGKLTQSAIPAVFNDAVDGFFTAGPYGALIAGLGGAGRSIRRDLGGDAGQKDIGKANGKWLVDNHILSKKDLAGSDKAIAGVEAQQNNSPLMKALNDTKFDPAIKDGGIDWTKLWRRLNGEPDTKPSDFDPKKPLTEAQYQKLSAKDQEEYDKNYKHYYATTAGAKPPKPSAPLPGQGRGHEPVFNEDDGSQVHTPVGDLHAGSGGNSVPGRPGANKPGAGPKNPLTNGADQIKSWWDQGIGKSLANGAKQIGDWWNSLFGKKGTISGLFDTKKWAKGAQQIKDWWDKGIGSFIHDSITNIKNWWDGLFGKKGTISGLFNSKKWAQGFEQIKKWWDDGIGSFINDTITNIKNWWEGLFGKKGTISKLFTKKGWADFWANIQAWWDNGIGSFINDTFTNIKNWWDGLFGKKGTISGLFSKKGWADFWQNIRDWWNNGIGGFINTTIKNVKSWWQTTFGKNGSFAKLFNVKFSIPDISGIANALLKSLGDGISSAVKAVTDFIGNLRKRLLNPHAGTTPSAPGTYGTITPSRGSGARPANMVLGYYNKGGIVKPQAYATGGEVTDTSKASPFNQGEDTVQAVLTPGEYVIKKDIVKKIGAATLDKLNKGVIDWEELLKKLPWSKVQEAGKAKFADKTLGQLQNLMTGGAQYDTDKKNADAAKKNLTAVEKKKYDALQAKEDAAKRRLDALEARSGGSKATKAKRKSQIAALEKKIKDYNKQEAALTKQLNKDKAGLKKGILNGDGHEVSLDWMIKHGKFDISSRVIAAVGNDNLTKLEASLTRWDKELAKLGIHGNGSKHGVPVPVDTPVGSKHGVPVPVDTPVGSKHGVPAHEGGRHSVAKTPVDVPEKHTASKAAALVKKIGLAKLNTLSDGIEDWRNHLAAVDFKRTGAKHVVEPTIAAIDFMLESNKQQQSDRKKEKNLAADLKAAEDAALKKIKNTEAADKKKISNLTKSTKGTAKHRADQISKLQLAISKLEAKKLKVKSEYETKLKASKGRFTDTVPAMLSRGEFVLQKRVVDAVGANNLSRLNAGLISWGAVLKNLGVGGDQHGVPEHGWKPGQDPRDGYKPWISDPITAPRGMLDEPGQAGIFGEDVRTNPLEQYLATGGLVGAPSVTGMPSVPTAKSLLQSSEAGSTVVDKRVMIQELNINNPVPEKSSQSLSRQLRKMAYFGALG